MPISVGWDYHEDEFIESTLEMVDREFNSCRIVVCDTLQVHTLKYTKSELAKKYLSYEEYAYDLGTEWIKRYSHLIERMKINVHLTRWGEYTAAPQYEDLKNEIKTNNEFQHLFVATAQTTYDGFKKFGRLPNVSPEKANEFLSSSIEYLIEECAVVLLWKQYHERILLYPKSLGEALIKIMEYYWGRDRDFLKLLQIRFKKDGLFPSKIQKVALLQTPEIKIKRILDRSLYLPHIVQIINTQKAIEFRKTFTDILPRYDIVFIHNTVSYVRKAPSS